MHRGHSMPPNQNQNHNQTQNRTLPHKWQSESQVGQPVGRCCSILRRGTTWNRGRRVWALHSKGHGLHSWKAWLGMAQQRSGFASIESDGRSTPFRSHSCQSRLLLAITADLCAVATQAYLYKRDILPHISHLLLARLDRSRPGRPLGTEDSRRRCALGSPSLPSCPVGESSRIPSFVLASVITDLA